VATRLLLLTAVRSLLTVSAGTLLLVSTLGGVAGLTLATVSTLTTGSVTGLALSGVSTLEACVATMRKTLAIELKDVR
jgi:hypothetical protein